AALFRVPLHDGPQMASGVGKYRKTILAKRQHAMNRDIAATCGGILGNLQAGRDVRPGVLLVVPQYGQPTDVDVRAGPHRLVAGRTVDNLRFDQASLSLAVSLEELVRLDTQRFRHTALGTE